MEEGLEEEVERRGEENTQEQVRMPMTMDGNEDTQMRLEPMLRCEHMSAMHLKTVRSVLRTTQCSRSVHCDVHAIGHNALRIVEVVREDIRSVP